MENLVIDKENTVHFFAHKTELTKEEDICLNNVVISEFKDNKGLAFLSNEHYYQAYKFEAENIKEEFRNKNTEELFNKAFEEVRNAPDLPGSKVAARKYEKELEKEWNKEKWGNGQKDIIMKRGLMFKFSQNRKMLDRLMESGDKRLAEESYQDLYWAGMLPNALNKLGNFLMELRDNFKNTKKIFIKDCGLEPIEI